MFPCKPCSSSVLEDCCSEEAQLRGSCVTLNPILCLSEWEKAGTCAGRMLSCVLTKAMVTNLSCVLSAVRSAFFCRCDQETLGEHCLVQLSLNEDKRLYSSAVQSVRVLSLDFRSSLGNYSGFSPGSVKPTKCAHRSLEVLAVVCPMPKCAHFC